MADSKVGVSYNEQARSLLGAYILWFTLENFAEIVPNNRR
jgi:hypothetical protein